MQNLPYRRNANGKYGNISLPCCLTQLSSNRSKEKRRKDQLVKTVASLSEQVEEAIEVKSRLEEEVIELQRECERKEPSLGSLLQHSDKVST